MKNMQAPFLIDASARVFEAAGMTAEDALTVATSLIENNLVGHDSHGLMRVRVYLGMAKRGIQQFRAQPTLLHSSASSAVMDADRAFGQLATRQAMDLAIDKAREHDMGMVAIRNCGHIGRLGEYSVQAAQQGMIGMVFCSGPGPGGIVAPFGGRSRILGTNPLSWAVPAATRPPVFFDFATSTVAWGKIQTAIDKGLQVPDGWLLTSEGVPTNDPNEINKRGVMLPFGAHKGYGMSLLIELIAGGLSAGNCPALPDFHPQFPTVVMAINIGAFQPLDTFKALVDRMVDHIKASPRQEGCEEILAPGEPEWNSRKERLANGIPVPEATWENLREAAAEVGVDLPVY